jgi:hypothetical protein
MRLADLVAAVYADIDPDAAMADLAAVADHDRYQASAGIAAAAQEVAARAEAAGLREVAVLSFPADGARRWWTYRAPLAWTPVRARLCLGGAALVRYPEQPYTLAAYSAPTRPGGQPARVLRWSAVQAGASPNDALVVVDTAAPPFPVLAARLAAQSALAVAADPLAGRAGRSDGQVGRLELAPGSPLAGFSVCAARLRRLVAAADTDAVAHVEVVAEAGVATLPVVTGVLPGSGPGTELLLSAHLCHPRPSANDNASGVAALLAVARVLASSGPGRAFVPDPAGVPGYSAPGPAERPALRFVWGPEFVGVAAYLHDVVLAGRAPRPVLAINVDMAGQDVQRCGGPLVIEGCPDDRPSFLAALAARCAALLPPAAWSYSGAVGCDPWSWRPVPFAGGSDHALLVDPPTSCPAISLGHWPDRTNHTSADTLDTVDPRELRRTATVAGASIAAVRLAADPVLACDIADATACWAIEHVLAGLPGRRPVSASPAGSPGDAVLDPRDDAQVARRVAHRAEVALGAVRSLAAIGLSPARLRSLGERVGAAIAAVAAVAGRDAPNTPNAAHAAARTAVVAGEVLTRCWPGPVNVRALAEAATPADRDWLDARLADDRGGNYARVTALMRAIDGRRDRGSAAWWAAISSELAIPVAFADRVFDMLCRAGYARTDTGGEGGF